MEIANLIIVMIGLLLGWYAWIVQLQTENEKDKEVHPQGPLLHNIKYLRLFWGISLGMRTRGRNSIYLSYKNESKSTCTFDITVDRSNEKQ